MYLTNDSYQSNHLMMQLDSVVENLRNVFYQLNGVGENLNPVDKMNLEIEKDQYFRALNEILPRLAEQENGLYGNYITQKLEQIYCNTL